MIAITVHSNTLVIIVLNISFIICLSRIADFIFQLFFGTIWLLKTKCYTLMQNYGIKLISLTWDYACLCVKQYDTFSKKRGVSYRCRHYHRNDVHQRLINGFIQRRTNWEMRNSMVLAPELISSGNCGALLLGTMFVWYLYKKKIKQCQKEQLQSLFCFDHYCQERYKLIY